MKNAWWVALACTKPRETGADRGIFVYGCAAPCDRRPGWRPGPHRLDLPESRVLEVAETVVDATTMDTFRNSLAEGHIDPAKLGFVDGAQVRIKDVRTTIGLGLGHSAAQFQTYHSVPALDGAFGENPALIQSLEFLEEKLGLPFKSSHAGRVGAFEVIDLQDHGEEDAPVLLEKDRNQDPRRPGPETLFISRNKVFASGRQHAHVVFCAGRDVIVDRLVALPPNIRSVAVDAPEKVDAFTFSLFSDDGQLLHKQDASFFRTFSVGMALGGPTHEISDELTRRAEAHDPVLGGQVRRVQKRSTELSTFGGTSPGSARAFDEMMRIRLAGAFPDGGADRWFPHGIEGEVGVIARLNKLLDGHRVREAVLVDPWFGTDALRRIVLRLENHDLHLTLLTSWTETDPDTSEKLPPSAPGATRLQAELSRLKSHLPRNMRVLNLADGARQGFHDRYLMLRLRESPTEVYLLSNSLNKAAGKWPYSMSRFTAEVARSAEAYIDGLCQGRDLARDRNLAITRLWPEAE